MYTSWLIKENDLLRFGPHNTSTCILQRHYCTQAESNMERFTDTFIHKPNTATFGSLTVFRQWEVSSWKALSVISSGDYLVIKQSDEGASCTCCVNLIAKSSRGVNSSPPTPTLLAAAAPQTSPLHTPEHIRMQYSIRIDLIAQWPTRDNEVNPLTP